MRGLIQGVGGVLLMMGVMFALQLQQTPLPRATAEEAASDHEKKLSEAPIRGSTEESSQKSVLGDIQVPPPPFSEDIFPCMNCHEDLEPDPERRVLEDFHDDIVLHHDEENRWCLDCHDEKNRDRLRLASGKTISFEESYLLCGQCHGPKFRDWKAGVHGKRLGRWDGKERRYLLCVHCHNPHSPAFPGIEPMPTPVSPYDLRKSMSEPYRPVDLPGNLPKWAGRREGETEDDE